MARRRIPADAVRSPRICARPLPETFAGKAAQALIFERSRPANDALNLKIRKNEGHGAISASFNDTQKRNLLILHPHRADYFNFSSQSNSLRVSHALTVLTSLFFPFFSAHSSWSSDMFTWVKRNFPFSSAE